MENAGLAPAFESRLSVVVAAKGQSKFVLRRLTHVQTYDRDRRFRHFMLAAVGLQAGDCGTSLNDIPAAVL